MVTCRAKGCENEATTVRWTTRDDGPNRIEAEIYLCAPCATALDVGELSELDPEE